MAGKQLAQIGIWYEEITSLYASLSSLTVSAKNFTHSGVRSFLELLLKCYEFDAKINIIYADIFFRRSVANTSSLCPFVVQFDYLTF